MKKFFFLFLTILAFTSCDRELFPGLENKIVFDEGAETEIYLSADERLEGKQIGFETSADWNVKVYGTEGPEETSETVSADWITLYPTEGSSGHHHLVISVPYNNQDNPKSRYGVIEIICGNTSEKIHIHQSAYRKDGSYGGDVTTDGKPAYFTVLQGKHEALPAITNSAQCRIDYETNLIGFTLEPQDELDSWVKVVPVSDKEDYLHCTFTENNTGEDREYIFTVLDLNSNKVSNFTVTQLADPQCRIIDSEIAAASIQLHVTANLSTTKLQYFITDENMREEKVDDIFKHRCPYELFEIERENETTPIDRVLTFDKLKTNHTYEIYCRATAAGGEVDYKYSYTTDGPTDDMDLILKVSANYANSFTVSLPVRNGEGTVDWGDGTVETYNDRQIRENTITHVYQVSEPTFFQIRFKGTLTHLGFRHPCSDADLENTLFGIDQWGYTGLECVDFSGCTSLEYIAPAGPLTFVNLRYVEEYNQFPFELGNTAIESIPDGFFDSAIHLERFCYAFRNCTKLKHIPAGLFRNLDKAEDFEEVFFNCTALEYIPEDLFEGCTHATSFYRAFYGCGSLREIPEDLFASCAAAENFVSTFEACTALQQIPEGLFRNCTEVLAFGNNEYDAQYIIKQGVFKECTSLTAIPESLFSSCKKVTDFSNAFMSCRKLTEIPAGLFASCPDITELSGTFYGCSLKSIPASLFDHNLKVKNFSYCFELNLNATGESPYTVVDGEKVHLYEREKYPMYFANPDSHTGCFRSCKNLWDYSLIPGDWN